MKTILQRSTLLASLLITGCAVNVQQLQGDVDRLATNLNDLRSTQAEQVADLTSIKAELQQLSGRIDELEHKHRSGPAGTDISSMRQELNSLSRRVPPPTIVPADMLEDDQASAAELPPEVAPKFENGLHNLRQGQFSVAQGLLEESLDAVYNTPQTPLVLFWLAVAEEGVKQNARAIKHYAEIVTRYPKHRRAPAALFRQGSVLIRIGDTKAAAISFKKLIADYPKTTEAARAKERLKAL